MTAKYSDMIRAIQAHDKGLLRYSRYSGESVNTLLAAVKNDARGNFNLMHAAEAYVNSNFIDVVAVIKKTFSTAIIVNPVDEKPKLKVLTKGNEGTLVCSKQAYVYLTYLVKELQMSKRKIICDLRIGKKTIGRICKHGIEYILPETENRIINYAHSHGVKFEDAEKYVLSLNSLEVA